MPRAGDSIEPEYVPALYAANVLGINVGWIYSQSRAADGPIRRQYAERIFAVGGKCIWSQVLVNLQDCRDHLASEPYRRLYAASVIHERIVDPADARAINELGIHAEVRQAIKGEIASATRGRRRKVA